MVTEALTIERAEIAAKASALTAPGLIAFCQNDASGVACVMCLAFEENGLTARPFDLAVASDGAWTQLEKDWYGDGVGGLLSACQVTIPEFTTKSGSGQILSLRGSGQVEAQRAANGTAAVPPKTAEIAASAPGLLAMTTYKRHSRGALLFSPFLREL